jgi:transcriptional regulator with XRE-family HTH domain
MSYGAGMLGAVLREARQKVNLTQEEVSLQANVDRSYLSQLENDHKSPTVDMLFLICEVLKVPPSEILAEVERRQKRARQAESAAPGAATGE